MPNCKSVKIDGLAVPRIALVEDADPVAIAKGYGMGTFEEVSAWDQLAVQRHRKRIVSRRRLDRSLELAISLRFEAEGNRIERGGRTG